VESQILIEQLRSQKAKEYSSVEHVVKTSSDGLLRGQLEDLERELAEKNRLIIDLR